MHIFFTNILPYFVNYSMIKYASIYKDINMQSIDYFKVKIKMYIQRYNITYMSTHFIDKSNDWPNFIL